MKRCEWSLFLTTLGYVARQQKALHNKNKTTTLSNWAVTISDQKNCKKGRPRWESNPRSLPVLPHPLPHSKIPSQSLGAPKLREVVIWWERDTTTPPGLMLLMQIATVFTVITTEGRAVGSMQIGWSVYGTIGLELCVCQVQRWGKHDGIWLWIF